MDNQLTENNKFESQEQLKKFTLRIPSAVRNVEWNLDNFREMVNDKKSLESLRLKFEVENTFGMHSKWWVYFKFYTDGDSESIGCFVNVNRTSEIDKIPVKFELFINSDIAGKVQHFGPFVRDFKAGSWGERKLFLYESLMAPTSDYLPNGTLTIRLRFEMYGNQPVITEITDKEPETLRLQSSSAAFDDISKLLQTGLNSDLVISTKDCKVFHAHRCILAARSPVFQAMFVADMVENSTGRVEIPDISSKAMDLLLKYCYSGSLESGWTEVAEEMIYATDKYDLPVLKKICDQGLIGAVTPESAMDLYVIAKRHGLSTAQADISLFVKNNTVSVLDSFSEERVVTEEPLNKKIRKQQWK